MFDTRKKTALSDAVALELVGHDHPRRILQALQQPSEEALGGIGISPILDKDVEHNALLVDGTPEIVLNALDPDEHLVEVPLVPWPWSRRRTQSAKLWPNFRHQRRTVSWDTATPSSASSSSTSRRLRLNT